ncbi:MAG: hypothetical protein AB7O98_10845 [Hyphomonadaceae bacterium]
MGSLRVLTVAAALACAAAPAFAQDALRLAPQAAAELRGLCTRDGGGLWGASLCGPLLVADPATRAVWATDPDADGRFRFNNDGWMGVLPEGVPIANAAVEWGGQRWIMVVGPLPEGQADLRVLVGHEAWHRVQDQLRLAQAPSNCVHLESEQGRYLLRLEMRALSTALRSRGGARTEAAMDALGFRSARLARFADVEADAHETSLDRNEGLASYTGVRLGAGDAADAYAARTLDQYDAHQAYARAYAYATGPAYGLLLDQYREGWRSEITRDSYAPASLLAASLRAEAPSQRQLRRTAERYGGEAIAREEAARATAQRARIAELRARFTGPRLELPLMQMQFEFDPTAVTPVEGLGSVYETLTLRDAWGEIRASGGYALINPTFTRLTAASPTTGGVTGPGWSLTLAPGYRVSTPDAQGVVRVEAIPPPMAPPQEAPSPGLE